MTVISRHNTNPDDFERQLVAAWHMAGASGRTHTIVMGEELYKQWVRREEDGPVTVLRRVGFVPLELDTSMDPFHARIEERERA